MSDDRKVYDFAGNEVTVSWDGRLCIHVQECTRAAGDLFESGRKPWCTPEVSGREEIADVVKRCPTGALTCRSAGGSLLEDTLAANGVTVSNNGPLYVQGDLDVDGAADDMPGVRHRAALCRCGASKNKPFCDNTHESSGFVDHGAVGETGAGELAATGGKLEIKRAKNGPLLLYGDLTIYASSGRPAWRGAKAALCRCGASKNKPFCDGAHAEVGFDAD